MACQTSPPDESPPLPMEVETDEAALSRDGASGRSARLLWTGSAIAVLTLVGVSACALPPLASHDPATPSRLVPEVAFIPSVSAFLPGGGLARPTGLRPAALPGAEQRRQRQPIPVPRMSVPNAARPQTWSNRLGVTLTPVAEGVWAAERPFIWNNIDVGSRSTIARMGDGSLLVHSPVEWDADLGASIAALGGGVGHIIAPSYEHLKYTLQWHLQYPGATLYGCPGLPARMPEAKFSFELPDVPAAFSESVDLTWMDCEVTPVIGKPFFNECVFYLRESKSFVCADAFWNYPASSRPNYDGQGDDTGRQVTCPKMPTPPTPDGRLPTVDVPLGSAAWKFGMDVIYVPFYQRFMVGDRTDERRGKYRKAVDNILAWDVQQIVPCHGDIIRGSDLCRRVLTEHFNSHEPPTKQVNEAP